MSVRVLVYRDSKSELEPISTKTSVTVWLELGHRYPKKYFIGGTRGKKTAVGGNYQGVTIASGKPEFAVETPITWERTGGNRKSESNQSNLTKSSDHDTDWSGTNRWGGERAEKRGKKPSTPVDRGRK